MMSGNEGVEMTPLHYEWAAASAADRPVAGIRADCKGGASRTRTIRMIMLKNVEGIETPEEDRIQSSVSTRQNYKTNFGKSFEYRNLGFTESAS
jgi:hypothetical protein